METFKKPSKTALEENMCSVWCPKEKFSCAQPLEWPFELGFTAQILKILEDNSVTLSAFWETLFERERAKESPEIYFRAKSFSTIFEKRAPVYSLEAPLLGLAKSIYYASAPLRSTSYVTRLQGIMVVVSRITLSTSESRVSGWTQWGSLDPRNTDNF